MIVDEIATYGTNPGDTAVYQTLRTVAENTRNPAILQDIWRYTRGFEEVAIERRAVLDGYTGLLDAVVANPVTPAVLLEEAPAAGVASILKVERAAELMYRVNMIEALVRAPITQATTVGRIIAHLRPHEGAVFLKALLARGFESDVVARTFALLPYDETLLSIMLTHNLMTAQTADQVLAANKLGLPALMKLVAQPEVIKAHLPATTLAERVFTNIVRLGQEPAGTEFAIRFYSAYGEVAQALMKGDTTGTKFLEQPWAARLVADRVRLATMADEPGATMALAVELARNNPWIEGMPEIADLLVDYFNSYYADAGNTWTMHHRLLKKPFFTNERIARLDASRWAPAYGVAYADDMLECLPNRVAAGWLEEIEKRKGRAGKERKIFVNKLAAIVHLMKNGSYAEQIGPELLDYLWTRLSRTSNTVAKQFLAGHDMLPIARVKQAIKQKGFQDIAADNLRRRQECSPSTHSG